MSAEKIATVKGGKTRNSFSVHFDASNGHVYVSSGLFGGKTRIHGQTAKNAQDAVRIAEAHVTNK